MNKISRELYKIAQELNKIQDEEKNIQQAVTDSQIGGAFGISPGNSKQIRKIRKVLKNNKN